MLIKMDRNSYQKELVTYMADKGFVYGPEPEIYGGLSGFFTYGPLGKRLKNRIEEQIRKLFTGHDFWEVECPSILTEIVCKASGHLDGFNDPVILCSKCNSSFRADKLIEEKLEIDAGHITDKKMIELIKENNITCPGCKGRFNLEIERHSLMMKTKIGTNIVAYNRPETATTTYLPFQRYDQFFRSKNPFSIFQIGKAFRNEISPRQHLLRCREFTQAEAQIFLTKEQKDSWKKFDNVKGQKLPMWTAQAQDASKGPEELTLEQAMKKGHLKNKAYAWTLNLAFELFLSIGIPRTEIRLRQHCDDEKAFYADDAWDIEIKLNSFGWTEVCGVHDRTDYDLKNHAKHSKQKLDFIDETGKRSVPHVLEIAFGVDRPFFALLDLTFSKRKEDEKRILLKIPRKFAPVQVAVFPLVKKDGLKEKAENIYENLKQQFLCYYDESGAVGRRYVRQDQIGTPFCITVDYDTMKDGTVTLRERDSMAQIRVNENDLFEKISELMKRDDFN